MTTAFLAKPYLELEREFKELLSAPVSEIEERHPSFLDIAGYPNHENVFSNIYQFFLEEKHHGMGRVFLSALDDCVPDKDLMVEDYRVCREVFTNDGGRIDITIEEVDSDGNVTKVILIENKVFHTLENDLEDYMNTYSSSIERVLIVLSLEEIKIDEQYVNITHLQWVNRVKERLGSVIETFQIKYLTLLQDFIQHIHRYYQKRIDMDSISYLFENGQQINKIKTLEQEGIKYISDEISKKISSTNWSWGRLIPSGLQIQRSDSALIGYVFYNKVYAEKSIKIELWLKGEKYVNLRYEKPLSGKLNQIIKKGTINDQVSENTKEWYYLANKTYENISLNQIEEIGNELVKILQSDWEEFSQEIEKEYIKV